MYIYCEIVIYIKITITWINSSYNVWDAKIALIIMKYFFTNNSLINNERLKFYIKLK